ncbi:MAG: thiamine biosynthesis protein ThiC [Erythrobacter sp.]|nr:thiamine biosynthesis protein ThiC [Erythrobacter sp.]
MDFTFKRNATITAAILLIAAITQAVYTGMYVAEITPPRQFLWGSEGLLFVLLAAFAGAALAQTSRNHLAFAAIAAAGVLNVVQVGVGLTMFGPFREVAETVPDAAPLAGSIVAFSFMVYNAAKVLLALALIALGFSKLGAGSKALGGLSVAIGLVAFLSNTASMAAGRTVTELPIAGGSGVLATILLAVCLFGLTDQD